MKILGSLLIIMCCTLAGIEMSRREQMISDMLEQIYSLSVYMKNKVRYEQSEPEMIIRTYPGCCTFVEECIKRLNDGCEFHSAWESTVHCGLLRTLDKTEAALICELGCQLGKQDAESEIMRIERIGCQLESMHQRRFSAYNANRKVYIACGLSAGLILMLLII